MRPEGPYCNERGDWWVPVESMGYIAARRLVKAHIWDVEFSRLVYEGREAGTFDTEHEWPCPAIDDPDAPERDGTRPDCVFTAEAWHFREVES